MAAALTILAKQRGDVTFFHQSLYYPVTDAAQDTDSYPEFADGPFLRAQSMAWFWDAYLPHWERRGEITASPLRAASTTSPASPTRSSSSTRTTSFATKARPTPASSPQPACAPPPSATTARSTTS